MAEWDSLSIRTINWTIIKQIWVRFHKASEFEKVLGINHNYFYEVINREPKEIHVMKRISEQTKINLDVLTGNKLLSYDGILDAKWNTYINLLESRRKMKEDKITSQKGLTIEDIDKKIKKIRIDVKEAFPNQTDLNKNNELKYVVFFAKYQRAYKDETYNIVANMVLYTEKLNWEKLLQLFNDKDDKDNKGKSIFDQYYDAVSRQQKLLEAIKIYKEDGK